MGVLNRTPDSFSDGGKFMDEVSAIRRINEMAEEGADIVDIGGESTRPGSEGVSVSEELSRTVPVIKKVSAKLNIPVSIDTSKHEVAREAIKSGASIVNDVTGLRGDPHMAGVIADSCAALCVMHMRGRPKTMQDDPVYAGLMDEIIAGLKDSIDIAMTAGIAPEKIIVDPGIGFGKTTEHSLTAINRLGELRTLGKPVLIGASRKSFIGNVLNRKAGERLIGTAACCALAIMNGANIIRVHDVSELVEVARITDAVKREADVI